MTPSPASFLAPLTPWEGFPIGGLDAFVFAGVPWCVAGGDPMRVRPS